MIYYQPGWKTCLFWPTRQCEQVKVASCELRETSKTGAWGASEKLPTMATFCNMCETSLLRMRVQKIFWNRRCEWKHVFQPGLSTLWAFKVCNFVRAQTLWGKKFHQVHFLWSKPLWNCAPVQSFGCFIRFSHRKLLYLVISRIFCDLPKWSIASLPKRYCPDNKFISPNNPCEKIIGQKPESVNSEKRKKTWYSLERLWWISHRSASVIRPKIMLHYQTWIRYNFP